MFCKAAILKIKPRYRGDAVELLCQAHMTNDGDLIGNSKGLDKGVGTSLTALIDTTL